MIVKLNDVVDRIKGNVDRFNTDLIYYVGGEHYESSRIAIYTPGLLDSEKGATLGFKFHFPFQKGDVLFMARNPHLRKAGMVMFDGICSDASYILRTKDSSVLLQEYLALIVQCDRFWNFFEANKSGSVNYLMNWKELQNYEFDLPSMEEQRKIADLAWAIERTRVAYEGLIRATDELVKSQFIEMFGDVITNQKSLPTALIGDVAECYAGATPSTKVSAYWENATIPWMSSGEVHNGRITSTEKKISQAGYDSCSTKMVPANSVVIALAGQGKTRGTVAITEIDLCTNQSLCCIIPNSSIISDYLYYHLKLRYDEMRNLAGISEGRGGLNLKLIQGIRVLVPPQADQKSFITFVRQTDKSKFELTQALEALNATYKKLISENLG